MSGNAGHGMPKRTDIKSILIPGSGPIVIGQACEFDYSGTQACKVLRREGFRTILVNSNPATIMTDPSLADATYIEPLRADFLERIIEKEKPDAILPTVGGQTALNLVMDLHKSGFLERSGVKLIGANVQAIRKAESREEFKVAMQKIGMGLPESVFCSEIESAREFLGRIGLPVIIRPSFTLGGAGGGIAHSEQEFEHLVHYGLKASPVGQILVEQGLLGWKEFELEVMRDVADNVVVVCSIENLDPMGVHTGDSITIAPQQTLTDPQYQLMRDAAIAIIREIGVDTGGSNIQFSVNPKNGDMIVIEMNPRVSRSSALASKATGFPIAKIAALLAVGYTLDEVQNDITRTTLASFEPSIDYVVTKVPRFTFEKFPGSDDTLGSMMKSVGETMSIGRTFRESFQKAFRSLETGRGGLGADGNLAELLQLSELAKRPGDLERFIRAGIARPHPERIFLVKEALFRFATKSPGGIDVDELHSLSGIDPWFLDQIMELVQLEIQFLAGRSPEEPGIDLDTLRIMKQNGFSDRQLAFLSNRSAVLAILAGDEPLHLRRNRALKVLALAEKDLVISRQNSGLLPVYKRVDTCAGEFEAHTPYLYSTYEDEDESGVSTKRKVIILGGGPNRIGQGIEFDYCCCHASFALQDLGIESIMVNSNPETVSTDYDTSDKLYFEPLTLEDVRHICQNEKPDGLIVQFGGQTPLKLARGLADAGFPIIGTSPDSIDRAEDRDRFAAMLRKLALRQPENGVAFTLAEAEMVVQRIGYPCVVRPSYVLGGRAMAIVYDQDGLERFMHEAGSINPEHPILVDKFLEDAIEIDVDALADGTDVFVAGIMEHIEEAGVHSGDSACMLPPVGLPPDLVQEIRDATRQIALELHVVGLLNIQFAIQETNLFTIEVNPRASRTVPFVSKAIGLPLAGLATRLMCGEKLASLGILGRPEPETISVKEAVLPFARFPGADIILGPEMKSTGEVMGIADTAGEAYIKAVVGAGDSIPETGGVFLSVADVAKPELVTQAGDLQRMGYHLFGTEGTCAFMRGYGIEMEALHKLRDGESPNALEGIKDGSIAIIINIPDARQPRDDAFMIRQEAIRNKVLCVTTVAGTTALVNGLKQTRNSTFSIRPIQEMHASAARAGR